LANWNNLTHFTWEELKTFSWDELMILDLNQLMYLKKVEVSENTQCKIDKLEHELKELEEKLGKSSRKSLKEILKENTPAAIQIILCVIEFLSNISEAPHPETTIQIEYVRNLVVDAIDSLHTDNHEALQQIEQKCHCHDDKDADIHPEDDLS